MKQIIVFLFIIICFISASKITASSISGSSAALVRVYLNNDMEDIRVTKMTYFLLKYNSPLATHSRLLVEASDNYELPWTLVASIAGVESGFCKKMAKVSYNCWGWKNGRHNFNSFEDGIFTVSRNLRSKYFNRGITTPELMAPIYAPPSKTWSINVRYYMNLLEIMPSENYPLQIDL